MKLTLLTPREFLNVMKTLINTLFISAALFTVSNAIAKSDSEYLSECKAQVMAEYGEVESIKVANINSKRKVFKAKLKVRANGEKSLFNCEIRQVTPVVLTCLKGACGDTNVAVK